MITPMPGQTQPQHPAGWYRTMEHPWATEHFGFPANPSRGDTFTAHDGSGWTFQHETRHGIWWEITRYADNEAAERLADDLKREADQESSIQFSHRRFWVPIAERLIEQGWRPPARVIETIEDLDALPFLSIVREKLPPSPVAGCDYGAVWERRTSGWECIAAGVRHNWIRLPATVLYAPEKGETRQ